MNENDQPTVAGDEKLARFVMYSKWIRASDGTVRPDAFVPHPYPDLSVTRHGGLTVADIWRIGQELADGRAVSLYGRADVVANAVHRQSLSIQAAPVRGNANHANIVGWPPEKPQQKIIAQHLAAAATFAPRPGTQP